MFTSMIPTSRIFIRNGSILKRLGLQFPLTKYNRTLEKPVEQTEELERRIDVPTHTHQVWSSDDVRMTRFIDGQQKLTVEKQAIDLIDEIPPTPSGKRVVYCDGGDGDMGHPRVYINLDKPGNHICGYCGLRFYNDSHGQRTEPYNVNHPSV